MLLFTYKYSEYDSTCTTVHISNIYPCDNDVRNGIYREENH